MKLNSLHYIRSGIQSHNWETIPLNTLFNVTLKTPCRLVKSSSQGRYRHYDTGYSPLFFSVFVSLFLSLFLSFCLFVSFLFVCLFVSIFLSFSNMAELIAILVDTIN